MHFLSVFLFALAANIDNFIVGTAYGIKKVHLNLFHICAISMIISAGTLIAMIFGKSLLNFIPIGSAGLLGGVMIIAMGTYYFLAFWRNKDKENSKDKSKEEDSNSQYKDSANEIELQKLGYKEIVLLGLALSLNNAGLGIGASITGLNIVITSIVSFIFSFMFIYLGNKLGKSRIAKVIGRYAEPASGLLIIALGLIEIYI
ncbi:MAG: sporulation membrane protein YtaF [Clostridiales bacterium]|jgi:putative sporulation protein YtaF|nr:sporulation membrane protein YtaF [Clostridiales bacterium]